MHHWVLENIFLFVLAGFSGFDLVQRGLMRAYGFVSQLPLKCYAKMAHALLQRNPHTLRAGDCPQLPR